MQAECVPLLTLGMVVLVAVLVGPWLVLAGSAVSLYDYNEDTPKFMRKNKSKRSRGKQTQEPHRCSHYFFLYFVPLLINWTKGSDNESYELPGAVRPQDRRESEQKSILSTMCVCDESTCRTYPASSFCPDFPSWPTARPTPPHLSCLTSGLRGQAPGV